MTQKLTITVSDQLKADIEPLRDSINISAICAAALAREVEARRTTAATSGAMGDAIARLRASRVATGRSAERQGFENGFTWVLKQGQYAQVLALLQLKKEAQVLLLPLGDLLGRPHAPFSESDWSNELAECDNRSAFWHGFGKGAEDAWSRIKDEVEAV